MATERTNGEPTQRIGTDDVPVPEELERQRTEMVDRDMGGGEFEPPREGYAPGAPPQPNDARGAMPPKSPVQNAVSKVSSNKVAAIGVGTFAVLAVAGMVGIKGRRKRSKQEKLIHQAEDIVRKLEEQLQRG